MKKYQIDMWINSVSKADTVTTETHEATLYGRTDAAKATVHNVTIDGLSPEMARAFGAAYAKPRGVRITIEVCEPGEEF